MFCVICRDEIFIQTKYLCRRIIYADEIFMQTKSVSFVEIVSDDYFDYCFKSKTKKNFAEGACKIVTNTILLLGLWAALLR